MGRAFANWWRCERDFGRRFCYRGDRVLYIVLCLTIVATSGYEGRDFQNTLPAKVIWGAPGKDIELPCDVTPPLPSDAVKMVFWFKDSITMPIYSLDARNGPLEKASHLAAAYDVGSRSYFITDHPSRARLKIKNVTPEDEGIFRCRVDFLNSPTRNFQVNLTLVELSSRPKIFDAEGKLIKSEAGPFLEGHELFLSCQVDGGRPRPSLTWWYNGTVLDNVVDTKRNTFTTVNQLEIAKVPRSFKGSKIECRASSMDIAGVIVREVPIAVYLRPTKVKIVTPNELMSSAKTHTCKCETSGSYPPAKLTWLLNGRTIKSAVITQEENESFSSSIVSLTVEAEDDGKDLVCRADNPRFPGGWLEDRRQIHVAYPPRVSVKLDSQALSPAKEGTTVILRCDTIARPSAHSFSWYQDGHLVRYNETSGVLPMDDKLTLRNIKKSAAGEYSCSATNAEGETYSPPYRLEIQYAPRCKFGFEEMRVGILPDEETIIKCHVDAVPNFVRFSWTYNTSQGVLPVQGARIENKDGISTLHFVPGSADIDSLSCWASNVVGRQEIPCLFHVIPANRPESPRNCRLSNLTHGSLEVKCTAGLDGGLQQSFILEVMDTTGAFNPSGITTLSDQAEHSTPLFRVLGDMPVFRLHSLRPRRDYQLVVYAENAKGRSKPPVVLSNVRIDFPADAPDADDDDDDAETNLSGGSSSVSNSGGSGSSSTETPQPIKQNLTLILLGLTAAAVLLIVGIVAVATVLACRKQPRVVLRQRRNSKPPDDLELSEAGFGEGFQRRSAQYRASLYTQEMELEANIRQTGPDLILAPASFPPQSSEY